MTSTEVVVVSDSESESVDLTPQMAEEPEGDGPAEVPLDYFFARYGTFMLVTTGKVPESHDLKNRLEAAVRSESRISSSKPITVRREWTYGTYFYPQRSRTNESALLSNSDRFTAIHLSDPVAFTVTVPIKNQPEFRGVADIPTDTYYAAWDGVTAIVLWPRQVTDKLPPRSGGHVVIDILHDLASSAGLEFYAQACNPSCTNVFAHQVMRGERLRGVKSISRVKLRGRPCVDVHLHADGDLSDVAAALGSLIGHEGFFFAQFKNYARRIRDLESYARSMVDRLLGLSLGRIQRSQLSLFKQIKELRVHRSDMRQMRLLISSLWLVLARIEAIRSVWLQKKTHLLDDLERRKLADLFARDQGDDDAAVMSQNLSFISSAIEQTANRQDSRVLAWTTGLVALAGVLGAVLGVVLTHLIG